MRPGTRVLLVLAILGVIPVSAQTFRGGTKPHVLQGKLAKDQRGAQQSGWFAVSIGTLGKPDTPVRWVGVTAFNTWDDDQGALARRGACRDLRRRHLRRVVVRPNKVAHYTPTFTVAGPPDLASQLLALPGGSRVALEGVLDPRARILLLDAVKPLPKPRGS